MREALEEKIGPLLNKYGYKLVVAESCTGGLISDRITNIPGSSEYYLGGICAYAYEAKRSILGVKPETLEKYGAVSEETVLEMSVGVRELFSKEVEFEKLVGISVSGIAGPGGGMPNKPVGLVWVSLSTPDGTWAWNRIFDGDRIQNKEYSSDFALSSLFTYLKNK
jgi:PncC family amidohydrolase